MKTLVFVLCLFAAVASAQDNRQQQQRPGGPPQPQPPATLPDNYVLNLSVKDKDQTISELSLVLATTDFTASFPDSKPPINAFSGTVNLEDGGAVMVRYTLNVEIPLRTNNGPNNQTKSSVTQASVRLRLGEQVQILRADTRTCRLSIVKLADQQAIAR